MVKEITIEIVRPVNPTGFSFIRYVYGATAARDRKVIDAHRREFTRLIQKIGFLVEEKVGTGKLITGKLKIVLDDNEKPIKAVFEEIKVWEAVKDIKEPVETSI